MSHIWLIFGLVILYLILKESIQLVDL